MLLPSSSNQSRYPQRNPLAGLASPYVPEASYGCPARKGEVSRSLVRSQSVDHQIISKLAPFYPSPVKLPQSSRDTVVLELQSQIARLNRTCWLLHEDLEGAREKLSSSMNSIKTFWSPELKRERALRKEEVARFSALGEQLALVLRGSHVVCISLCILFLHSIQNKQTIEKIKERRTTFLHRQTNL